MRPFQGRAVTPRLPGALPPAIECRPFRAVNQRAFVTMPRPPATQPDTELPAFVKWLEFVEWLFQTTAKFPKQARFSFCQRIEGLALDTVEDLIEARYSKEKRAVLRRINLRLEKLRVLMRLSHKLRYLSTTSYEHAARSINEVGQMIGSWIKQQEQL